MPILTEFLEATPTAELEPLAAAQSDEVDMGVKYSELGTFGYVSTLLSPLCSAYQTDRSIRYLRKVAKLGPWSMYEKLLHVWGNELSPREIYEKVRHFSFYYGESSSIQHSRYVNGLTTF